MRTFVIGDVHGYAYLLRSLLNQIRPHARPGDALVFAGDYIDRGPDSMAVVQLVMDLQTGAWEGPVVPLRGNHEEILVELVTARRPKWEMSEWERQGGEKTLASYGFQGNRRRWKEVIPRDHLEWFRSLPSWHADDHAYYVHAGVRPGVPVEQSSDDDLLWIREEFIKSDYVWDKVVVFGHTPQYEEPDRQIIETAHLPWRPLNRPEKIGIDTGVAYGGPLSAVMLPERRFFAVR